MRSPRPRAALLLVLPVLLGAAARHPKKPIPGSLLMPQLVLKHLESLPDYRDLSSIYAEHRTDSAWLQSDAGKAVAASLERMRSDAEATKVVMAPERALQYSIGGQKVTDSGIAPADLDKSLAYRETMADAIARNIATTISAPAQAALAEFRGAGAKPAAPPSAYESGLAAAKARDWNGALEHFLDAQKDEPNSPQVLFNLALASEKIPGRELRAMAWFQAYLLAAPNAPDATSVRGELARLESDFEKRHLAILDQEDALLAVEKKNIAEQMSDKDRAKWAHAASNLVAWGAENSAAAHYFLGDEKGALSILHAAAEEIFQHGRLVSTQPGGSKVVSAMVSAGLGVDAVVRGKQVDFHDKNDSLDYLLEEGDLSRAWKYLDGWKTDDAWTGGVERFECAARDRGDVLAQLEAGKALRKRIPDSAEAHNSCPAELARSLWWSTGRMDFLIDVGRNGMLGVSPADVDTRIADYLKEVGEKLAANPSENALWTPEPARIEGYLTETYRRVRGPRAR